ncbi:MAG: transketolase N-terminal domain/subunit/transketolase C-terminal domain/subunit [Verrucomicrobiales bacterium]|jgi:transketolase N-terminal domain/subunit/transketolase C-terminal domain/subunit
MSKHLPTLENQAARNKALIDASTYMRDSVESRVLPWSVDLSSDGLSEDQVHTLNALEKTAARTALASLASLAKINELDHLGGGLELIPSLLFTLGLTDYEKVHFTIEHAHTSIGYYASLSTLGFLDEQLVVDGFRRGLDIAGHVSWVPGGTQLNGGRLGVMVPVAVGQALGERSRHGDDAWVICHTGDAGWISGQALNGFNVADFEGAPVTFVMHRNGIQLSGSTKSIMDKDPRPIVEALGVKVIEVPSLHCKESLFKAYKEARALARQGRPSMIYPTGSTDVTIADIAGIFGIEKEVEAFAGKHGVAVDTKVWGPGSLMSFRDLIPMLECIFLVNELPGGEGHHDGHMKGRDLDEVCANPMMVINEAEAKALAALKAAAPRVVVTTARPAAGSPNLVLTADQLNAAKLPEAGGKTSARGGSQAGYEAVAKAFPEQFFNVSCDLDPSTKLDKAVKHIPAKNSFQLSIEEQVATLVADGLAMCSQQQQVQVFATFSAFFEGIAREGLELWRYQRNLNGVNEGLNVIMHLSHVGACTGRDHFSGWSLDWITLAMGYLPYIDRFYSPADARSAYIAVTDACARYGGSIVGIPRDNLPVLEKQDGGALYNPTDAWEPITAFRTNAGAKRAILALGATGYLGGEAAATLAADGVPTDAYIVNGLPAADGEIEALIAKYSEGIVTIEDGIIAHRAIGLRGFASIVSSLAGGTPTGHVGIVDPRIAPSEGHEETWDHFGINADALVAAVKSL